MATADDDHPFDVATEDDKRVNQMLAETDGAICSMQYNGPIGYHINIAKGETSPEYLWKVALLQALDETVFEMMYVDEERPADARRQIERDLEEYFDPFTAEHVAELFEEKLENLIQSQEDLAEEMEDE